MLESVLYSVTQKVLISDTTLRLFILTQVRKMTSILRQICECEICIITKDIQIDLIRSRTKIITFLQHKSVERYKFNIPYSTISAARYKEKVFPYGEILHDNIKYAYPVLLFKKKYIYI